MDLCHRPTHWQGATGMWRKESCPTHKKSSMPLLSRERRNKELGLVCPASPGHDLHCPGPSSVQSCWWPARGRGRRSPAPVSCWPPAGAGSRAGGTEGLWGTGAAGRVTHSPRAPTLMHPQSANTALPAWNCPGQSYSHSANVNKYRISPEETPGVNNPAQPLLVELQKCFWSLQ